MSHTNHSQHMSRRRMSTPLKSKMVRKLVHVEDDTHSRLELETELRDVTSRMMEVARLSEQLVQENAVHEQRIITLEEELSSKSALTSSLKEQLKEKDHILLAMEDEQNKLLRQLDFRDEDIERLQEELHMQTDEQDILRMEHEEIEETFSRHHRKLTFDFDEKVTELEKENESFQEEMALLKKHNRDQKQHLRDLKRSNQQLKRLVEGKFDEMIEEITSFIAMDTMRKRETPSPLRRNGSIRMDEQKSFDEEWSGGGNCDLEVEREMADLRKDIANLEHDAKRTRQFVEQNKRCLEDLVTQTKPVNKKVVFYLVQEHCTFLGLDVPNPEIVMNDFDFEEAKELSSSEREFEHQPELEREHQSILIGSDGDPEDDLSDEGTFVEIEQFEPHEDELDDHFDLNGERAFSELKPKNLTSVIGESNPLDKKTNVIEFFRAYAEPKSWKIFSKHGDVYASSVFSFRFGDFVLPVDIELSFLYPLSVLLGHIVGLRRPSIGYAVVLTLDASEQVKWFSQLFRMVSNRLLALDDHNLWEFVYSILTTVVTQHNAIHMHAVKPQIMLHMPADGLDPDGHFGGHVESDFLALHVADSRRNQFELHPPRRRSGHSLLNDGHSRLGGGG